MANNLLPVFLHVPRSGGTYIYSWMLSSCWFLHSEKRDLSHFFHYEHKIFTLNIKDDSSIIFFRMIIVDEELLFKKSDLFSSHLEKNYNLNLSIRELYDIINLLQKCKVFCASIESAGIPILEGQVKDILDNVLGNYEKVKYFCIRNPKDRLYSLYNYIKSADSKHELTHNSIVSSTFEGYLLYECEDNWLIRQLLNIKNRKIKKSDLHQSKKIISKFQVFTFDKVDNLIKKSLYDCHRIIRNRIPNEYLKFNNRNRSSSFNSNDFNSPNVSRKLIELVEWDLKLFEFYFSR